MPRFVNARDKPCISTILECEVILSSCIKEQRLRLINLHLYYISRSTDFIPAAVNIKYHNVGVLWYPWYPIIDLHLWIHPQRLYYPWTLRFTLILPRRKASILPDLFIALIKQSPYLLQLLYVKYKGILNQPIHLHSLHFFIYILFLVFNYWLLTPFLFIYLIRNYVLRYRLTLILIWHSWFYSLFDFGGAKLQSLLDLLHWTHFSKV
jgi:hypothetical protein